MEFGSTGSHRTYEPIVVWAVPPPTASETKSLNKGCARNQNFFLNAILAGLSLGHAHERRNARTTTRIYNRRYDVPRRRVAARRSVQNAVRLLGQAEDRGSPSSDAKDRIEIWATRSVFVRFSRRINQRGHFTQCVVAHGNDGGSFRRFCSFTGLQHLIGQFSAPDIILDSQTLREHLNIRLMAGLLL